MSCQLIAFLLACLISTLFVVFMYILAWSHHRETREGIILRSIGTFCAIVTSIIILLVSGYIDYDTIKPTFSLSPSYLFESIIIPVGLTLILFIGPIIDAYREGTLFALEIDEGWNADALPPFFTVLRAYLVGPFTEEYLYRFLMINVLIQCFTTSSSILISSGLFSISHINHYIERLITGSDTVDWLVLAVHLLQTFVFACYAGCIFIRAKSVLSLFLIHSFCNWMGAPRVDRIFADKRLTIWTFFGLISCITLTTIYMIN
ncbi:CAAX prenyl protease 2 [Tetranychus urticae]|uniref:CAAX prenyl protease 2 n=1 Tax=Tetranychus urticae TaxID=32264 RepID=T1KK80_TETUR|nr:CAAX prenyl protease 2 [Tetranychus urticae]